MRSSNQSKVSVAEERKSRRKHNRDAYCKRRTWQHHQWSFRCRQFDGDRLRRERSLDRKGDGSYVATPLTTGGKTGELCHAALQRPSQQPPSAEATVIAGDVISGTHASQGTQVPTVKMTTELTFTVATLHGNPGHLAGFHAPVFSGAASIGE